MDEKQTSESTNPIDELSQSEKSEIEFPNDEATQQEVSEFLWSKEAQNEQSTGKQESGSSDAGQGRSESESSQDGSIPRDDAWANAGTTNDTAQNVLGGIEDVEVTEDERNIFWKSVLTDTPFSIPIPVFDGSVAITLRERYNHEQQRVMDILQLDIKEGNIDSSNIDLYIQRLQEYFAALMVVRIADQPFSDIELKSDSRSKTTTDRKKLKDFISKHIWSMTTAKWNMVHSAMQRFESKCHRLRNELHNQNFWKPRDTGQ